MLLRLLSLISSLAPLALADIKFTSPPSGGSVPAGVLNIQWEDSGSGTPLSSLVNYQLFLMAGGNDDSTAIPIVDPTTPSTFQGGSAAALQVPATKGASTPANAYYIKIVAAASQGGQIINYSDRFTITGMTGSFPPAIAAAIPGGTTGPTNQDQISNNNGAAAAAGAGSGTLYMDQTGMTKYAPMVGLPPTKISAPKNPTPLNPTSAFTIVKTPLPIATSPLTTITASNTFSVSSVENGAAPAPMPSDDMAKFLNRWKD